MENGALTPTQEGVLVCVRRVFADATATETRHRPILHDLFAALCHMQSFACRLPPSARVHDQSAVNEYLLRECLVPFGETCMRMVVEMYIVTAHYAECVAVLPMIVTALGIPLARKYECAAESTWTTAARALQDVVRHGLPIVLRSARQSPTASAQLWPALSHALNAFIFHRTCVNSASDAHMCCRRRTTPLSPDELARHEHIDCELIEMVRDQMLAHAAHLPTEFVGELIRLLNDGSVCTQSIGLCQRHPACIKYLQIRHLRMLIVHAWPNCALNVY
jgi:hypothetical protein